MSIDYRTLLTGKLIGRKEIAAKASHRPENVLTLYQDANSAGCMADAVLATRIPDLCPDCNGSGHHWIGTHENDAPQRCSHPNAPTIADLLRWGENLLVATQGRSGSIYLRDQLLRYSDDYELLAALRTEAEQSGADR